MARSSAEPPPIPTTASQLPSLIAWATVCACSIVGSPDRLRYVSLRMPAPAHAASAASTPSLPTTGSSTTTKTLLAPSDASTSPSSAITPSPKLSLTGSWVWNDVTSGVLIGRLPPDGGERFTVESRSGLRAGAALQPGPPRPCAAGGSGTPCDSAARTSSRSESAPRSTLGARSESVA